MANKYRAIPEIVDGIRFASKAEAKRYSDLKLLERAGNISRLELQPKFKIVVDGAPVLSWTADGKRRRPLTAIMDFAYFENGKRIIEDKKGTDTPISRLKRALVEHIYKVKVVLT